MTHKRSGAETMRVNANPVSVVPVYGEMYRLCAKVARGLHKGISVHKGIPVYDNPSGESWLRHDDLVIFLGEELNPHWKKEKWTWWRVFCVKNQEIGFIGHDTNLQACHE